MKPSSPAKATDLVPTRLLRAIARASLSSRLPRVLGGRPLLLTTTLLLVTAGSAAAADGDLDTSFSLDGIYDQAWGFESSIGAVAGLGDGSIFLGGWVRPLDGDSREAALLKLRQNGTLDSGFATGGRFHMEVEVNQGSAAEVLGVYPLPDGRILLAVAASETFTSDTFALVRLEATGVPDLTFGPGGLRIVDGFPLGGNAFPTFSAAVQAPDGDVLAVGPCWSCGSAGKVVATRLTSDGDLDLGFGDDGWVVFHAEAGVQHQSLAAGVDADGRLVVAGNTSGGGGVHEMFVARLTSSGGFDTSFDGDGLAFVDFPAYGWPDSVAIDPVTRRIFVASHNPFTSPETSGVVALHENGELDGGFGFAGITPTTLEEGTRLRDIGLQSDGKIVAAGWMDHTGAEPGGVYLVRLLANGAFDNSFHGNGVVRHELALGAYDEGVALALVGGRLVVGGYIEVDGDRTLAALRTRNQLIFSDGFERGNALGWSSSTP